MRIQLERKKLENGVWCDDSIFDLLCYYNGILELFMESVLEKWQRLGGSRNHGY